MVKAIQNPKVLILLLIGISFALASCSPIQNQLPSTSELDSLNEINALFGTNCAPDQISVTPQLVTRLSGLYNPSEDMAEFTFQTSNGVFSIDIIPFSNLQSNRGISFQDSEYQLTADCTDPSCAQMAVQVLDNNSSNYGIAAHEEVMLNKDSNDDGYTPSYACEGVVSAY